MSEAKKNTATLLVEIAEDLYVLGCTTDGYTWAAPKQAPEQQRPLAEIRPDIAAMFQVKYDHAPNATALGDAMTVLEGRARQAAPVEATERLRAMLAGADSKATQLVKLAREHYLFGVTTSGDVYAVPAGGPNIARPLRGGRRSLRGELARLFYEKTKSAPGAQALADALLVLEGESQGMDPAEVSLRAGRDQLSGELVLDLGRDDGQVVVIAAHGWKVTASSPALFWRTNATLPLPVPTHGSDLGALRKLLNIAGADWPLVVAWLIAALIPGMPHPVLVLRGEHGTAKSSAARLLTSLIDRCASQLRTASRNVEDWAVACAGSWVTCLDNVSDLQPWLQDAICRAVTGDGMLRRELYTNSDVAVLAFRRVIMLTGIDFGPVNGDLADRLLSMELERIPEDSRAAEEDIEASWREAHPAMLGALLDVACQVLGTLPSVRRAGLPRMADFARVVLATDKVLGTDGYSRYAEQAGRTAEQVADSDPVIVAIRKRITVPWEGSASDLLDHLTPDKPPNTWPSTPQGMGGALSRAAPVLRRLSWTVDYDRDSRKRTWTIAPAGWTAGQDPDGNRTWKAPKGEETPADTSSTSSTSPPGPDQGRHDDDPPDDPMPDDDPIVTGTSERHRTPAGQDTHDVDDISAGNNSPPRACPRHQTRFGPRKGCRACEALAAGEDQ